MVYIAKAPSDVLTIQAKAKDKAKAKAKATAKAKARAKARAKGHGQGHIKYIVGIRIHIKSPIFVRIGLVITIQ